MLYVDKNSRSQVLSILCVSLATLNAGVSFTWAMLAEPELLSPSYPVPFTESQTLYFLLIPALTMVKGSHIILLLMNRFGRKPVILSTALAQIVAWVLTAIGGSVYMFYAALFITGLSDVTAYAVVPIYVAEISTPVVRSSWGSLPSAFQCLGSVLGCLVQTQLGIRTSAIIWISIPVLLAIVSALWMVESPYYYAKRDDKAGARKVMQQLRNDSSDGTDIEVDKLFAVVATQLEEDGKLKHMFCKRNNLYAILVGVVLRFVQNGSGFIPILLYAQPILKLYQNDDVLVFLFYSACVASVIVSFISASMVRRRLCFHISTIASTACFVVITLYFKFADHNQNMAAVKYLPLAVIFMSLPCSIIGSGLLPSVICGEIFNMGIKANAMHVTILIHGLLIFAFNKLFSLLDDAYGMFASYAMLSVTSALSVVMIYTLLPETFRRTLIDIHQGFGKKEIEPTEIRLATVSISM